MGTNGVPRRDLDGGPANVELRKGRTFHDNGHRGAP